MKKRKAALLSVWCALMSLASPFIVGCIYMDITGHGKGWGYDMGSEADIAVAGGVFLLIFYLLTFVPAFLSLCISCYKRKKILVFVPAASFLFLFAAGIWLLGWQEFLKLFGYGY